MDPQFLELVKRFDDLKNAIINCHIASGDRLPSLEELTERKKRLDISPALDENAPDIRYPPNIVQLISLLILATINYGTDVNIILGKEDSSNKVLHNPKNNLKRIYVDSKTWSGESKDMIINLLF
jgi:hypothetical protein